MRLFFLRITEVTMKDKRFQKENILTIPNMISLFRIILIPIIIWLYCCSCDYTAAAIIVALSGITDIIDGKIARKINMVSDLGKVLDPIADKLTQLALICCLTTRFQWMWGLLILLIIKECLMILWGYLTIKTTNAVNSAKWYGKLSTVILYVVLMILIFYPDISENIARFLIVICGLVMCMSLILYGRFYASVFKNVTIDEKIKKTLIRIFKIILIFIWIIIISSCLIYRDNITVEGILAYTPHNLYLAFLMILGLFALKSLSIFIYSGILYAAAGILFPLPIAFLVNLIGTVIMLSLPYLIGQKVGTITVNYLKEKYPKLEMLSKLRSKNDLFFSFLIRIINILPCDIVSLYMEAVNVEYKKYIIGGLLGMLPPIITFPIMGMSIKDVSSPQFIISCCVEIVFMTVSIGIYYLYCKKHQ